METRLIDATKANLLTFWDGHPEDAESVARRTAATIQRLGVLFPVDGWRYSKGRVWGMWPAALPEQSAWVASKVFTSQDGVPEPVRGFSLSLSQEVDGHFIDMRIRAGSSILGGRMPANRARVTIEKGTPGPIDTSVVDPIIEAVVDVWEPLAGNFRDDTVLDLALPTTSWQVPIGHRIWLHQDIATIDQVAAGITITHRETGTVLAAPDDWPAHQVVDAMRETLAMNNVDSVPHEN